MHGSVPATEPASQRNHDAWAIEVIQATGADLLGYLTRRTSPAADAADVLSNVLVVIWAKSQSLPLDALAARMWSFGVARNALRDYRRQGARREKLADALRANLDSLALERDTDPLEAAHRTQRGEDIRSNRYTSQVRSAVTLVAITTSGGHRPNHRVRESVHQRASGQLQVG